MIDISRWIEIFNIEDPSIRCQTVLNEIQPKLREIFDSFVEKYNVNGEVLKYKIHTYESTLDTNRSDSKNPKYNKNKNNFCRKAFVGLTYDIYDRVSIFKIEADSRSKTIKIVMDLDFYPFWRAVLNKTNEKELDNLLRKLDPDIEIKLSDDEETLIKNEEFIKKINEYKGRKTPWFKFGLYLPFKSDINEEDLVDLMWDTFVKLEPLRKFIERDTIEHLNSLKVIDLFKNDSTPISLIVYGQKYQVNFEEATKSSNKLHKQSFSIYDNDQLITQGWLELFFREPRELLGVVINGREYIYIQLRKLQTETQYKLKFKKAFRLKGKNNENNENQTYQLKSNQILLDHGFQVDETGFYVGTYDNNSKTFLEPIGEIKQRLITASLIFADVLGAFTLPKNAPEANNNLIDDEGELSLETYSSTFDFSSIEKIISDSQFTFSLDTLRDFHLNMTCLVDKHFVILSGISGTGKTQLCRLYANAVYGLDYSADNPYLRIIPVRPDWMDSTALFGYYSSFEKRYMRTEFLDMLIQANKEKDKPHFIVLDELNLARVEYYLSDYLSAVESRKPIHLHNQDDIEDIPKTIEIPHNFYLIGTINVDETTHSISDKVLDRAFVMTLSEVDFEKYWEKLDNKYKDGLKEEWGSLIDLHQILSKYELHFGYRTMNEILRKLYKNLLLPEDFRMERIKSLDRVISEKILPKIRGDEKIIPLMAELESWTKDTIGMDSITYKNIVRMREELERYGATQFWR
ncbi:hypothetical protein BHF71_10160 [Vulcanibacillus modesticaldus]|uniref:Uncharacterized protein n=1 Tax=Vulcanibacillus modesticaldus TaxID=337097 RepID=A0A1D2YTW9_9BACI|nr:AAA family ATPase [Vulcanibacillus modesticaldus]OEF99129.1 hypothetical protein BHF71_10160 [Vulcanibacillus modesticaldus]